MGFNRQMLMAAVLLSSGFIAAAQEQPMAADLDFSSAVVRNVANGKNTTVTGNPKPVEGPEGLPGLDFSNGGYVEVPAWGNPETFSGEAWINMKAPGKSKRALVMIRRGKGNQWQFWLEPENGAYRLYCFIWGKGGKDGLVFTGKANDRIQPGKWHHVAFEIDGKTSGAIYIDGKEVYRAVPAGVVAHGSSPLRVGGDGNYVFNGAIAGAKVYDGRLPAATLTKAAEAALPPYRRPNAPAVTLGFERDGAWRTAPVERIDAIPEEKLWNNRTRSGKDWLVKARTVEELALGAKTVTEHVTEGKKALRWADHPAWPTLYATDIPHDWSGIKSVSVDIHSTRATDEIVIMALASDTASTAWRDFYYVPLRINWTGDRRLTLPLDAFQIYGQPAGMNKIDAIYFFTKMFGCQPHPYTELYLDNIQLNKTPADNDWKKYLAVLPQERQADNFTIRHDQPEWQQDQLNHGYPEIAADKTVTAPYSYQTYFQNERAQFKYYPRFVPGYICFDPSGKTYINSGDIIQWRGQDGKWQKSDLLEAAVAWAKKQGWKGLRFGWAHNQSEKAIRFDQDGDAYVMIMVERLDDQGKTYDWKTRRTLLFHSRDKMKSWTAYLLPDRTAEFEKLDGHNRDCLKRPPVILLGDFGYFRGADHNGYVMIPKKNADGTLTLPQPVKYAEDNIGPCQHSGGGNQAITVGDKVYIVYGWSPDAGAYPDVAKELTKNGGKLWDQWKLSILKNTALAKTLPPIPADHPGLKQQFYNKNIKANGYSYDGVPTFIVAYDIPTGTVSKPVFIGCGGAFVDGHNWPAITIDGKGFIHVIINGHHNPVTYTRSMKPYDISAWTAPVYIRDGKDVKQENRPHLSYATLNCDKAGNLYCVHRSTTGYYNNHLALYRMTPDGVWSEEQTLVTPFKFMYSVWGQKMMYDPGRDRLCLSFFGQSSMKQLSRDQYEFDVFYWPEHEKLYNTPANGLNNGPAKPDGSCTMLVSPAMEMASLIYDNATGKWHLVTTKDLK